MSYREPDRPNGEGGPEGMARLDRAVETASRRLRETGKELASARAEISRLVEQLQRFTGGEENPSELLDRLHRLQGENELLRERLKRGREGVERLLAKIRFLEEQG